MNALVVPARFCGPARSGNGGWTAGALAAYAGHDCEDPTTADQVAHHERRLPTIAVSLRRPPPLDTALAVHEDDGWCIARSEGPDGAEVARAQVVEQELREVAPVPFAEARAAQATYAGLDAHPFPTCFVCGTGRDDGLRIFPGRVSDHDGAVRVAATWTPAADVAEDWHAYVDDTRRASLPVTWSALDCIGAWAGDLSERLMVLARMTARIDALPVVGEEHVVVGAARGQDGRKTLTASTLYDARGQVVGVAEHLWITVDPADFN